ncbi:hypothetical protein ACHAWO_007818, partial [Cyclotella atomus]
RLRIRVILPIALVVGVSIKKHQNGYYEFTQRALIDSIIDDVGLGDTFTKPVPAKSSKLLHHHKDSPSFSECGFSFGYQSVTGKVNYLARTTRPDIMFAMHQIAKFSSDPRKDHGEAIIYLVRYLMKTRDLGLRFKPDPTSGFECYCDADFAGNWHKDFAMYDPSTAKSRSGWVIFYAKCPIIFASCLQTQVALSTTEAEYIALSTALQDVIPIMELMDEMRNRGHKVVCEEPIVYCKVFEDNSGALELARLPKLWPRTKHINTSFRRGGLRSSLQSFEGGLGDSLQSFDGPDNVSDTDFSASGANSTDGSHNSGSHSGGSASGGRSNESKSTVDPADPSVEVLPRVHRPFDRSASFTEQRCASSQAQSRHSYLSRNSGGTGSSIVQCKRRFSTEAHSSLIMGNLEASLMGSMLSDSPDLDSLFDDDGDSDGSSDSDGVLLNFLRND